MSLWRTARGAVSATSISVWVLAALLPGAIVQTVFLGAGVAANILIACTLSAAIEALCLVARGRPPGHLRDGSVIVTAVLIALCLPPDISWYVIAVGCATAVGLAKHAFGGTGQNIFNPAMVGYAAVLVSFPGAFSLWPLMDGSTGATALTLMQYRGAITIAEVWQAPVFGRLGGAGWEWVNAAYLAGGVVLMATGRLGYRIPAALLGTIALLSMACYDQGGSHSAGSPLFHWFSGSLMLGAFFVATDPVTHPVAHKQQWVYGILVGVAVFVIRAFAAYPDGIAFAVLLGNAATPLLNQWGLRSRRHKADDLSADNADEEERSSRSLKSSA